MSRWLPFLGFLLVAIFASLITLDMAQGMRLFWNLIHDAGGHVIWSELLAGAVLMLSATVVTAILWMLAWRWCPRTSQSLAEEDEA